MPVEHIIFLSVDLVELALEYGFAGIKMLFFFYSSWTLKFKSVK